MNKQLIKVYRQILMIAALGAIGSGCASSDGTTKAVDSAGSSGVARIGSASAALSNDSIARQVKGIAQNLTRQKIMYRQGPGLRDCSGIFHRVLNGLRPQHAGVTLPSASTHRTTRQLARWYFDQGALRITKNPRGDDRHIAPGTVLFFGRPGTKKNDLKPAALFGARGIVHMGVVVDIQTDASGRVASYGLFHGRRTGKPAAITRYHKRDHARYPAYGNGSQPWVAYAPIIPSAQQ